MLGLFTQEKHLIELLASTICLMHLNYYRQSIGGSAIYKIFVSHVSELTYKSLVLKLLSTSGMSLGVSLDRY